MFGLSLERHSTKKIFAVVRVTPSSQWSGPV